MKLVNFFLFLQLFYCIYYISFFCNASREISGSSNGERSKTTQPSRFTVKKTGKIAFLVTGQLARLELGSKIRNIFIPNHDAGNTVHVMIYLDNDINNVKQTFWKFNYSDTPFVHYNEKMLSDYLVRRFRGTNIKFWIKLGPPGQDKYEVVGGIVPVSDKIINVNAKYLRHTIDIGVDAPEDGVERAEVRFQNNMRWLAGLRDCMKWVQKLEQQQGFFYDLTVRLRDDTYALSSWLLDLERYAHKLTSSGSGSYRGVNDHNFVIDREWSDDLFRGLTEDYYFNKSLFNVPWGNPEHRIYQIATAYNIPIQNNTLCQQPLIPLRGMRDEKHWQVHPTYTHKILLECTNNSTLKLDQNHCVCDEEWKKILKHGFVLVGS